MTADVTPLRLDWPLPQDTQGVDERQRWWLTYNRGYLDGIQSILDQLGLTGVDLGEVTDAARLAANEPGIRADKIAHGLHLNVVTS